MIDEGLKVTAIPDYFMDQVSLYIQTKDAVCTDVVMSAYDLADMHKPSPIKLSHAMTQRLFDQLWDHGFRPHNNKYGNEVVNTMSNHLADMRKIAFKFLKLEDK